MSAETPKFYPDRRVPRTELFDLHMFEDAYVKLLSQAQDVPTTENFIFAWRPSVARGSAAAEFGFDAKEIAKLRQTKMV